MKRAWAVAGLAPLLTPSPAQTELLRACLLSGEDCREAWSRWRSTGLPLSVHGASTRRLLPLLHANLERNAVEVPPDALTLLRTAAVREKLRMHTYRGILCQVEEVLARAGIEHLVLKGAALAGTVYADWSLRHTHDIDLLLAPADLKRTQAAFKEAGYGSARSEDEATGAAVVHGSGMSVALHTRLFPLPYYNPPLQTVWQRARIVKDDVTMRVMSPEDSLVHLLGHAAASPNRESLQWVCDAVMLIAANPRLDWPRVEAFGLECSLALPLAALLGYLAHNLGAPVSSAVLEHFKAEAESSPAAALDAAFSAAFATSSRSPFELLGVVKGRQARLLLLRWIALPSPAYLRWSRPDRSAWLLPYSYLERPLTFLRARRRAAEHRG